MGNSKARARRSQRSLSRDISSQLKDAYRTCTFSDMVVTWAAASGASQWDLMPVLQRSFLDNSLNVCSHPPSQRANFESGKDCVFKDALGL